MNLDSLTQNLPPQVGGVVNQLLQVKIGNVKIDFSKVKFPTSPAEWKRLGQKIKEELAKLGKQISIEDAIRMAKQMAEVARKAKPTKQGGGGSSSVPAKTKPEKAKEEKNEISKTEKEVSSFIERAAKDKRYWFGILMLVLLLRKK